MGQLDLQELLAGAAAEARPAGPDLIERAVADARRRRGRRLVAVPSLLAVVTAVALLLVPVVRSAPLLPAAGGGPGFPAVTAGFSHLTANARTAPAGRAIAVVQYYWWDSVRTVVLGADRDTYRDLDPGLGSASFYGQAVLSPDGTLAAVARGAGQLDLVTLRTGKVRTVRLSEPSFQAVAYAFSPDGRTLAAGLTTHLSDAGPLLLVDVARGSITPLPLDGVSEFAFSPDGQRIATQSGGVVSISDRSGVVQRSFPVPRSEARLGGPNAWSPDGRYLVTVHESGGGGGPAEFTFLPVDPADKGAPATRSYPAASLLGWRSGTELVLGENRDPGQLISIVDLVSGRRQVVSSVTGGAVTAVAAGLLTEAGTRPAGDPDFGPWPSWLWWLLGGGVLVLALVSVAFVWGVRAIRASRRPLSG
ncbi:MAG: hypothetical protein QOJ50_1324 [Cryptosporangiaceae bacterium]|nr:hypothetical protein [Cryptosporangiaceae bacterium]